ncbi:MAG: aldose 1-epimerase [Ginsengibacter sp.]
MFSIEKKIENGFEKIILKEESSGTRVEIIPSCSAMLHAFIVNKNGEEMNVIDSYSSLSDFQNNVTVAGFKGCKLSPFVCRIKDGTYSFGEKEYKIEKYYNGENALHGELYDKSFEIMAENAGEENASVTMIYHYNKEDRGYPFSYDCTVTWQLESDNKLRVKTECINKDKGLIPMQDGWHPYFDLGGKIDELMLEFQSMEMVEFDHLIPTGKLVEYDNFNSIKILGDTVYDNCFTLNQETCQPMCVLRNAERNIRVEFHPSKSYSYLQLYTPEHRKSIAIENLSGAPDAFNNGMGFQTLEPGESSIYEMMYKVVILPEK